VPDVPDGPTWVALSPTTLPVHVVADWLVTPSCGANVVFTGTARDHAPGRAGVERLEYEAYEGPAIERMEAVAAEARHRWPTVERLAILHRVGVVELGDAAVVVGASSAHRAEAFEAARFLIDTVKATVPLWKHETWEGGAGWGTDAQPIVAPARPEVDQGARG
jgi:molybdopterin synthase catalytic subunit